MTLSELGIDLPTLSVLGKRRDRSKPNITHVGILPDSSRPQPGIECNTWHCGPPVSDNARCSFHVAGHISQLSATESAAIQTFVPIAKRELKNVPDEDQYVIRPPERSEFDEQTGRKKHQRFSCVGFVLACYRAAEIQLVDLTDLPKMTFDELKRHNPSFAKLSDEQKDAYGVSGVGPWEIPLAGYVIRAFNRSDDEIRNTPFRPRATSDADVLCEEPAYHNGLLRGKCVGVRSGHRLAVRIEGVMHDVRLSFVVCPTRGEPFKKRAKQFTSKCCFGKNVSLIPTSRHVSAMHALVIADGCCVQYDLLRSGLARLRKGATAGDQNLQHLQNQANKDRIAIWSI